MKKYKVIALATGGLNKVFKSGDTVTESDFERGGIDHRVKNGFIKEIPKKEPKKK